MEEILLQVGVKIALRNEDGRYLLLKRSTEKYPEVKNLWDIVGGRIVHGSPLIENLKREVKEETDLDLLGKPKLIAAQDILRNEGHHVVRLTYLGEVRGEPILSDDHETFGWFTIDEMKNLEGLDEYFSELIEENKIPA